MSQHIINETRIAAFAQKLREEERATGTIENYLRHIRAFIVWLEGGPVREDSAAQWKAALLEQGYRARSVNAMLAGLHCFFRHMGWSGFETKPLKIQRQIFRSDSRELTRAEYDRLIW